MKDYIILIGKYNENANKQVVETLKNVKEDDLNKDVKVYYKSIRGTFEHILAADMRLFSMIKNFSEKTNFENEEILNYFGENYTLKKEANKDLNTLFETRKKMDKLIIDIIESIKDFEKKEEFKSITGAIYLRKRIQIILHILNHATHHRGEISAVLDELGYKNDFSSLVKVEM